MSLHVYIRCIAWAMISCALNALLLLSLTSLTLAVAAPVPGANGPPNFLFLLSESLDGRLLRPESPARIPFIRDLLASNSVRFDTAYSNSPVCAPSRSSLWSGRAPHQIPHMHNGMHVRGAWNNWEGLPKDYSERMDQLLAQRSGYSVSLQGKSDWTVGGHTLSCMLASLTFGVPFPYNITDDGGWNQESNMCATDAPLSPGGSSGPDGSLFPGDWTSVQRTVDFMAKASQPFFAYVGTNILHPPYMTNAFWYARTPANTTVPAWAPVSSLHPCDLQASMRRGCLPGETNASAYTDFYSTARREHVRRVYLAELEELDAMVGALVDGLRAAGRLDNTYIVLAADHGDMQLEHQMFYKMVPYDASSRVPLIIASPLLSNTTARTVFQPVQLLDIFPTVLELAGQSVPGQAEGYSLVPFLRGAPTDPSRPDFVTFQNHDEDIGMSWFAVTDGRYKLVQYGTGKEVVPQLFDLLADPGEMANLFNASAAYRNITAVLDTKLRSSIDYPDVAMDVATYQKEQFRWWAANGTTDWRSALAAYSLRWSSAWHRYPKRALDAITQWMNNDTITVHACDGRLSNVVDFEGQELMAVVVNDELEENDAAVGIDIGRASARGLVSASASIGDSGPFPTLQSAATQCFVTDHGAKGDNTTDNSEALQALLDAGEQKCGVIIFPSPGWFVTRALNLTGRSSRTFFIEPGAVLVAWRNPNTYNTTSAVYALLWADESVVLANFTLAGGGTIHGGGRAWWPFKRSRPRPHLIYLQNVFNLVIANLTLIDSPSWNVGVRGENILIEGMQVTAGEGSCGGYEVAPNTDGFNIGGVNIHVRHSRVHNGDDCVPLTLGVDFSGTRNVLVEDVNCSCGTNGAVIYVETRGAPVAVQDVVFRNMEVHGTNQGGGVKIGRAGNNARGGLVTNVTWSHINIYNTRNAALYTNVYAEDAAPAQCVLPSPPLVNEPDWLTVANVTFSHVTASVPVGQYSGCFVCSPRNPCNRFHFDDVTIVDNEHGRPAPAAKCFNMEECLV